MSDEILKQNWCEARKAINRDSAEYGSVDPKRRTALERLADSYRRFMIIGFIFAPISLIWSNNGLFDGPFKGPFSLVMVLYFLTAALMDRHLLRKISEIDVQRMPTAEVSRRAMECRCYHFKCIAILLPVALLFIVYLAWQFRADPALLWGMATGAVIGFVIGVVQLCRFLRDYRSLRRE